MSGGMRIARVNELLKREIADLIERLAEVPEGILVTVGSVVTTPDLRHAKVNISVFGGDENYRRELRKFLHRHRPALQRSIAHDVVMKFTPVLEFIFDDTFEKGDKVLAMIDLIEAEIDPPRPEPQNPEPRTLSP
jgi:ribosome-binding factor A